MKQPLVYLSIAFAMGCVSMLIFISNNVLGAVIAASFLIVMLFDINKYYFILITLFFLAGACTSWNYFNFEPNSKHFKNVRVIEMDKQYILGNFSGRKVVFYGSFDKIKNGQKLYLTGEFKKNLNIKKGIIGTVQVEAIVNCKEDYITKIYNFKDSLFSKFQEHLNGEEAAFVMAICFGDTKELSLDQKTDFQKLGVIHAISVSGFHLAIIYKIFEALLGIYPGIVLSVLYVIFTGAQPSTVRAFIMIFILKLSKKANKNYDVFSSIGLSALLILLVSPYYILDIGFNLSYLSTLSIVIFNKPIMKTLTSLPKKLSESISVSLSSQILSLPYAAFSINNISTGFLMGNIVLLPLYTIIVIIGNIAMCFSSIEFIFSLICKLIKIVMLSIQGATLLLLKVCLNSQYFTLWEGWILTLFIISILLAKSGIKKSKYVIATAVVMLMFNHYNFWPRIIYINSGKSHDSIVIKYKYSTIIVTGEGSSRTLSNYKNQFGVTRVISTKDGPNRFLLGNKYIIDASELKTYNQKYKTIELTISSKYNKILFTRNKVPATCKGVYDIIKLPKDKEVPPLDFRFENIYSYYIFKDNTIRIK